MRGTASVVTRPGVQPVSIYAVSHYCHTHTHHSGDTPHSDTQPHPQLQLLLQEHSWTLSSHYCTSISPPPLLHGHHKLQHSLPSLPIVSLVSTQIQTGGSSVTQQHPHTTKTSNMPGQIICIKEFPFHLYFYLFSRGISGYIFMINWMF